MRYRAFKRKKDGFFYFQFLAEDGTVLLNSQSYTEKNTCFDGIKSVIQNAASPERYESSIDGDGKHFFILKAANGQEIGRSTKYNSEDALNAAISQFNTDAPKAVSKSNEKSDSPEEQPMANEAASPYKEGPRKEDDYRPLAFYETHSSGSIEHGFETFEAEGEFYFTFNSGQLIILISEGYQSAAARDNGVASVEKNLPIAARHQRQVHPNGKHYFNLRAGNNQEIATSRWFDSEAEMESVIGILSSGGQLPLNVASGGIYKDYRPLNFYQERIEGVEFGYDTFAEEDRHYFTVNFEGQPVLISETYQSDDARDNGVSSVKKNVKNEKRYERLVHPNGKHYFNLRAGNNHEIATSRWFDDKKEMEKAIRWLLGTGGTRRRKKAQRTKSETERVYISQNQAYLCNNITYDTFQSGGNQRYYFVFKDKDGKAVLINGDVRGYGSKEDLEAGIKAVLEFAPQKDKYELKTTKNGKHYFYIKNKDGKNVARGSLFYDDKGIMESAMQLLMCVGAVPTVASAGSERVVDDYLPCAAYAGDKGFYTFFDEDRNEYYFAYNRATDDKTVLRSEGYTTSAARDNGIQSVIKNAPIEKRWGTGTVLDGKYYYYYLRAGNNQEIGRSCYYSTEAEMLADLNWIKGESSPIGMGSAMVDGAMLSAAMIREREAASEKANERVVDDYLPCEAYAGDKGFYTFFNEDRNEHYFAYNRDSDDKTILRSEGYTTPAARDNGIQSVIKNAPIEKRWGTDTVLNGKYYYYYLRAGNNQEIGRSCYYDDEAAMLADLNWVKSDESPIGAGSAMVEGMMLSAAMIREREAAAEAQRQAEEEARLAAAKAEEERLAALAAAAAAAAEKANERVTDDYLPCEAYAGNEGFHTFYNEDRKEHYFSYNRASDNKTLLRSEGYTTTGARDNGIQSVIKNAPLEECWGQDTALNGKYYYYYLRAGNNQEIARSCYYDDQAAMLADFNWVKGEDSAIGAGSALVGGALMSAAMIRRQKEDEASALAAAAAAEAAAKQKAEEEARLAAAKAEEERKAALAAAAAADAEAKRKKAEEERKAAAVAAAAAAAAAASTKKADPVAAVAGAGGSKKGGGLGWLLWLIPLLLLLAALLYFLRGCEGCNPATPPVDPEPISTPKEEPKEEEIPQPYGKGGSELGFIDGSMEYLMADHLRGPDTKFPRRFQADKITFGRNSARLNTEAKKQLENLAVLLKEYPNARINIYGFLGDNERSSYRGSKEVTLDDVRAREVYNHLKSLGIDESRMNFQGEGVNDRRGVDIELISRD